MAGLRNMVFKAVCESGKEDGSLPNKIELMGKEYWSARYKTDEMQGICEDGDKCSIRYVNTERGKAFKMKSSKFMRAVMLETQAGKALSPSVVNWICGDVFAKEWHTFTYGCTCGMKLHVDGDFRKIYDSGECRGDFDSCMTDRDRYPFYMYAVRAKAAYLTDEDGRIVARAVLFTDVTDQNGRKWRLLERQYATGRDDMLKYILINKLIQEKQIDGYKIVGASCNEANAFVSVDGQSLSDMNSRLAATWAWMMSFPTRILSNGTTSWRGKPTTTHTARIITNWTPPTVTCTGMKMTMGKNRKNGTNTTSIIARKRGPATGTDWKSAWMSIALTISITSNQEMNTTIGTIPPAADVAESIY